MEEEEKESMGLLHAGAQLVPQRSLSVDKRIASYYVCQ